MIVRPLKREDVSEAVRILLLSFDKELSVIFKDLYIAGDVLKDFLIENPENCFVAEERRILGFSRISLGKEKIFEFLRKKMGLVHGLRASLLMKFFVRNPRKEEAFIDFIAVSPLRRREGIGSAMMEKLIEVAREEKRSFLSCLIKSESESLSFFERFGFKVEKVLENKLAERYFSARHWLLLRKDLSPDEKLDS
uniref:N-acetyltransferase n=1 Tax=Archaeoglobus fulgidus TaxID=2234 RepID=A0A7J2TIR7_ARCFL